MIRQLLQNASLVASMYKDPEYSPIEDTTLTTLISAEIGKMRKAEAVYLHGITYNTRDAGDATELTRSLTRLLIFVIAQFIIYKIKPLSQHKE